MVGQDGHSTHATGSQGSGHRTGVTGDHARPVSPPGRPGRRISLWATWLAVRVAGRVSTRLGGALAWRLWFTPWRTASTDRSRRREDGWLRDAEEVRLTVAGTELIGYRMGEGPMVLLVHGWGDHAARLGAFASPLVAAGFEVVGLDLPSHGRSADGPVDLYSLAAVVSAVVDRFGARAVVAHSLGATATTLALWGGMHVDAVVLLAPPVRLEHAVDRFVRLFRVPRRAGEGLRARLTEWFGPGLWTEVALDRVAVDLDVPVLVVHDRDDPQVDVADARLLTRAWPGSQLELTDGLGHHRLLRDPGVVDAVVGAVALGGLRSGLAQLTARVGDQPTP